MADSVVSALAAPTPQVTWSHRPDNAVERAEILRFLQVHGPTLTHPALHGTYTGATAPAAATYGAALAASADAHAKVVRTVAALDQAEAAFAEQLRVWSKLVEALHGAAALAVTGPVLGDRTPSQFRAAPTADKLVLLPRLWELVAEVPELVGLPQTYAALQASAVALGAAFADNEAALNARATAVAAAGAAVVAFDRQYGALVRLIKVSAPTLVPALPRFRRVRRGKPAAEAPAPAVPDDNAAPGETLEPEPVLDGPASGGIAAGPDGVPFPEI